MQRHDFLHEFDILHQADNVVGEELDRRNRAHSAGIQRGRMHVAAFHQAEHLARHAAHLQRFPVKLAGKRIQRPHDVGDRAVAVQHWRGAPRSSPLWRTRSGFVSFTICSQKSTPTRLS